MTKTSVSTENRQNEHTIETDDLRDSMRYSTVLVSHLSDVAGT